MGIWIRSQNKEILKEVNDFSILDSSKSAKQFVQNFLDDNSKTAIGTFINDNQFVLLGEYKAKERALEVLDEIQKTIYDYGVSMDFEGTEGTIHSLNVYEMPQE